MAFNSGRFVRILGAFRSFRKRNILIRLKRNYRNKDVEWQTDVDKRRETNFNRKKPTFSTKEIVQQHEWVWGGWGGGGDTGERVIYYVCIFIVCVPVLFLTAAAAAVTVIYARVAACPDNPRVTSSKPTRLMIPRVPSLTSLASHQSFSVYYILYRAFA